MITKQDLLSAGYVECDEPYNPLEGECLFHDDTNDPSFDGYFSKDIHGNDYQTFTVYMNAYDFSRFAIYNPHILALSNTAKSIMDVHTYGNMELTIDYPDTIANVEAFFLKFYNQFCSTI